MEILRVPSSTIAYTVTGLASGTYDYTVVDSADLSETTGSFTVTGTSDVASISLPSDIDGEYEITIDGTLEVVNVVRPYVDPNTLGTTPSEVTEYKKYERLARAIVDSVVSFYNEKQVYEVAGNGLDLIPIWKDVNSVLRVYENNVLIYDHEAEDNIAIFGITKDKTAIYKIPTGYANIIDTRTPTLPISPTDYAENGGKYSTFPRGYDYTFILDVGPKKIPDAVVDATTLLIDDLKCGKLEYFQRYVTSYNTDQYKIQFDKKILEGTGNILVDKILSKYGKSISRVGVL
jgi:hypothetical protein